VPDSKARQVTGADCEIRLRRLGRSVYRGTSAAPAQARRLRSAATLVASAPIANSHGRQLAPTTAARSILMGDAITSPQLGEEFW